MFSMGNPWGTMLFHKCLRSHKIGTWRNGHSVFIGKKLSITQEYVVYTSSVTTAWRLIHFSFLLPVLSCCFSSHRAPKIMGFPSGSDGKESVCNAEDPGLIPGSGRSPGEGNGNILVFLPGKFYGPRSLAGYGPWGTKESDLTEWHTHQRTSILPANKSWFVVVVELLSYVRLFVTPRTAACQASLYFIIPQSLLQFMSIELVMLSNHLILCHPLLLLPSIFPIIRVLSSESDLRIRWQSTGASASTSVLPMNI